MSALNTWSGQDEADFASNIRRYTTKTSADLYLQCTLAYYKDQRYSEEQLTEIEKCMRDILDRTYFEEETQAAVSGLKSGRIKKDPKNYSRKDWDNLETMCKPYSFVDIRVRGSDAARVLKLVESRNKYLSDNPLLATTKGKIKWDVIFEEGSKD